MKRRTAIGILFALAVLIGLIVLIVSRLLIEPPPGLEVSARTRTLEKVAQLKLSNLVFYLLALLAVGSATLTALHKNIMYAAMGLLGAFGGVAGLFIYLSADFLAVTQLAVYVGGVLVLVLFAVMLTNRIDTADMSNPVAGLPVAGGLATALAVLLLYAVVKMPWKVHTPPALRSTLEDLGHALLQDYLLPFEIASVVLLGVIIGAVIIVRKEVRPDAP